MRTLLAVFLLANLFASAQTNSFPGPLLPPLLVRDRIPLDSARMRGLAQDLQSLANEVPERADPQHKRARDQLLALARVLDPVGSSLEQRSQMPFPQDKLERIDYVLAWILSPEAGPSGQNLGNLILDPLSILFPARSWPRISPFSGEYPQWKGFVPPLSAYLPSPLADRLSPSTSAKTPKESSPLSAKEESSRVQRTFVPVTRLNKLDIPRYHLAQLHLDIKVSMEDTSMFDFIFEPHFPKPFENRLENRLFVTLARMYGELPKGRFALVRLEGGSDLEDDSSLLSGPIALLAHAALEEIPLSSKTVFLAEVAGNDILVPPNLFWEILRFCPEFRDQEDQTLLVPLSAEDQIHALLATRQDPKAYRSEIIGVETLSEALSFASAGPNGKRAQASRHFSRYLALAEENNGQNYSKMKKHLGQVLELLPNHLSAKVFLAELNAVEAYQIDDTTLKMELSASLKLLTELLGDKLLDRQSSVLLKQELASRLLPLQAFLPPENRQTLERFFVILELAQQVFLTSEELGDPKDLSKGPHYDRFLREISELKKEINSLAQ